MTEYSIMRGAYIASPIVCTAEYKQTPSRVGNAATQKYETDATIVPSSNIRWTGIPATYGAKDGTNTMISSGLIAATAPNGALFPVE